MGRASRRFCHRLNPLNGVWRLAAATLPGSGTGLPLQGNVCAVTWEGSGKAVKAHRRVLCRDGPCIAHVLNPSKWSMATWPGAGKELPLQGNVFAAIWEGSGKAVKAHRGVLSRDEQCSAHVLKPSKWSMATWPGAGTGLPLQGNMFAVTWEGSGKGLALQGNVFAEVVNKLWRHGQAVAQGCCCTATCVCGDLGRQWQSGKGPQTGFVSWWAVLRARFETL